MPEVGFGYVPGMLLRTSPKAPWVFSKDTIEELSNVAYAAFIQLIAASVQLYSD